MGGVEKTHFSHNFVAACLRGAFWINFGATLGAKIVQKGGQESSRSVLKSKSYFKLVFVGILWFWGWVWGASAAWGRTLVACWENSNFHVKVVVLLSVLLLLQNVAADVLLYTYFSKCTFFKANFS